MNYINTCELGRAEERSWLHSPTLTSMPWEHSSAYIITFCSPSIFDDDQSCFGRDQSYIDAGKICWSNPPPASCNCQSLAKIFPDSWIFVWKYIIISDVWHGSWAYEEPTIPIKSVPVVLLAKYLSEPLSPARILFKVEVNQVKRRVFESYW